MSLTAFLFPVKQEASGLIAQLEGVKKINSEGMLSWRGTLRGHEVVVALLGIGADSVKRNLPLILQSYTFDFIWVSGFGGGLDLSLKKGEVVWVENFSSENLEWSPREKRVKGITVDHVVTSSTQKLALSKGYQAQVVDMESEVAHRIFLEKGISHATLRGISDPWSESLPAGALNASFDPEKNRPTPIRLLIYLAIHPEDFLAFFRFVIGLSGVQKNLTKRLIELEMKRREINPDSVIGILRKARKQE